MAAVVSSSMAASTIQQDQQRMCRTPSPNSHHGDTIEVKMPKTASSDYSGSSSAVTSPDAEPRTATTQTPSSIYPLSNGNSGHKRKRSDEEDNARGSPPRQYDYSPPAKRAESQHMADRALHVLGTTDPHHQYYQQPNGDPNGHHWDRDQQPESATTSTPNDDDHHRWDMAAANGQHYEQSPNGQPAKRKRNFANRTKTGCMTCRSRKKKCDEARPYCNNCLRGGFSCRGYVTTKTTNTWPTMPTAKPPVPLQSKDGPPDAQQQTPVDTSPTSYRQQHDAGQVRPVPREEYDKPHYQYPTGPPNGEPRSRPPYPGQPWPPPQQQQAPPPYTKESHLPPLSEISRPDTNGNTPTREMQNRAPTQGGQTSSPYTQPPPPQQQQQQQQPPQPPPPTTQAPPSYHYAPPTPQTSQPYYAPKQDFQGYNPPPPPARPASSDYQHEYSKPSTSASHSRISSVGFEHPGQSRSLGKTFTIEEVERSKMLRCAKYNHFDPTLRNERQRCERALRRFNEGSYIESGLEDEEIRNLLWKVFDPSKDGTHNFIAPLKEKGTLSHGVRIEAPFTCTYGYNLKVMDNVYIGAGTVIDDAAKVEIGARSWVGPGVTIMTSESSKDMVERKGAGGFWIAKPVIIGTEVVVGRGAVIYPDVRLERGCTVEPGAVVRESLREGETLRAFVGPRVTM